MLQVHQVSHSYGGSGWRKSKAAAGKVLDNVSFDLEPGCCLGLLGTSGAGKSTLGKIVLGLQKPASGQVTFEGFELYTKGRQGIRKVRRDLQAVFQDCYSAVNPLMTADHIIGEPLRNYERLSPAELKRRTGELLEQVGLAAEDGSKRPSQFSGGQLQRVNIARAIALKPKLIVLDEPISSLDMVHQTLILDLLSELKDSIGLSYLFITHDIQAVMTICDRVAVMDKGQIVYHTDSPSSLPSAEHEAVQRLVSAVLPQHPSLRTSWV
ncbi:nickel import ATP-binding protein NikE [Saccharibacillus kuerlensis]|uniref:Peptide ABC transporter ATP-binding protein n=1 Tax=Saccharibacillus kuerlensis TaxID=459527 RepID=A0ABQ2L270_9BACL|nr:nickel import ATP-binding protein NikE [Saccharibacillus kuerlensis]GGN98338.1 peptide ABC transporter ATP-binding protein [Saccharibacillus kuerlensis]